MEKTLAQVLPKGVEFDPIMSVKLTAFLADVEVMADQTTANKMRALYQQLADEVAKVAFSYSEEAILDKSTDKIPLAYVNHRPDSVMAVLKELGDLAKNTIGKQVIWGYYGKDQFESFTLEVEKYGWRIGRDARYIVV